MNTTRTMPDSNDPVPVSIFVEFAWLWSSTLLGVLVLLGVCWKIARWTTPRPVTAPAAVTDQPNTVTIPTSQPTSQPVIEQGTVPHSIGNGNVLFHNTAPVNWNSGNTMFTDPQPSNMDWQDGRQWLAEAHKKAI